MSYSRKLVRNQLSLPWSHFACRGLGTGQDLDAYCGVVIWVQNCTVSPRHIHIRASQSEPFGVYPARYPRALQQTHSVSNRLESHFVLQRPTTPFPLASRHTRFHSCQMIDGLDRWTRNHADRAQRTRSNLIHPQTTQWRECRRGRNLC
jgi:hypothetical protein